ncbi:OmpA family protein [Sphingobacterium faecale]|uniref:OmpA family protein n=1 Tax=Sphingobacterium faecale TaxID=2803775 RepID=A0ABS1QZB0_9SPHI|nr:OmpA family protein [Sphingobacterium faecale]MBL1407777.1 OmpA family protein [Sphingobacterium faecale]
MKKFLLALMLFGITFFAFAQERQKGDLQIGVQGGASLPVSNYKKIGEAKTGFYSGLFIDQYFKGNMFGLGVDARYIRNDVSKMDSFYFENGHISTNYKNKARFQDYLFTIGPSYKFTRDRFHMEAYVRGGIMMQYFPEYDRILSYSDTRGTYDYPIKSTTNDSTNKANSWAGLGGLRFNYMLNANLALFAHVDYVQSFGTKFGNKPSQFAVKESVATANPITASTTIKGYLDHYEEVPVVKNTLHQTVQAGVGIKYIFSRRKPEPVALIAPNTDRYDEVVKTKVEVKDIQIMVRDKQTDLALSGVIVSIEGVNTDEKSTTDANGLASKLLGAKSGVYKVVGEKNGIKTPLLTLTDADFSTNSSVIFKEIFHDDPRFTLIGETFDCTLERNLPNINTVLTNSGTRINSSQISDAEGKFIYQLDAHSDFTVMANQKGQYSQTEIVTTKGLDRGQTLYVTLKLGVCDLEKDGSWVLKNILYDFDKSNIRSDAALVLDNVVAIMKQNPSLRIELSSHTDSRGDGIYNQKLSQRRADAAVAYLVNNGIAKDRLVAKGYGESKLLNGCGNGVNCSEEQHQENRRTEIKILDYTK